MSGRWKYGLIITLVAAFAILLYGGVLTARGQAPIPDQVVANDGSVLATAQDIRGGQAVFLKYGLMNYGSVLGNGSYFGPDYTAETIHITTETMKQYYAQQLYGTAFEGLKPNEQAAVNATVVRDIKSNRYDPASRTLTLSMAETAAFRTVTNHYNTVFETGTDPEARGITANFIRDDRLPSNVRHWVSQDSTQVSQLAGYFFWTGWTATTLRPGHDFTYTNNWPYDIQAGNTATFGAVAASAYSIAILLVVLAGVLYLYRRYRLDMEIEPKRALSVPGPQDLPINGSVRALAKFLVVVVGLLLVQTLLGGYMSHLYAEPTFFGLDLREILPFNVARSWHLQLAIFWVATAWMATGLYVSTLNGDEPRHQRVMINVLFGALLVVALGSLAGEWLGVKGYLGNKWWELGTQGWEYIELGRIWQILLVVGLGFWLFIVARGLYRRLVEEKDRGGLTHLLLYSVVGIPVFYLAGFFMSPDSQITIADYWRWWVIHLWVEGMFEVFTVVVLGYLLNTLGLVKKKSLLRALYFQLILILGSGIVGTGHHYYFTGAANTWLSLGAVFSALEVIPLTLLLAEAYEQYRVMHTAGTGFAYRGTFMFLMATAFWNLVGAGGLGFLINLPVVNYFEHGSFLTAAHGHGALMGVYGMLAIGLLLFVLRGIVKPEAWDERLVTISFWGLNVGLAGMIAITLVPVGMLQFREAFLNGFWAARTASFYASPLVHRLLWLRMIPDSVFIVVGVLPLLVLVVKGSLNLRTKQHASVKRDQKPDDGKELSVVAD